MTTKVRPAPATAVSTDAADTIIDVFDLQVRRRRDEPALFSHEGGTWRSLSWSEYGDAVREVAAGLVVNGLEPGDRVALLSGNRVEWHVADLASLTAACVTVPLYQTSSPSQVEYVLGHSGARVCFVEDATQLAKVVEVWDRLPDLAHVVVMDGSTSDDARPVISFAWLRVLGRDRLAIQPLLVDERRASRHQDGLATLVYTSGTTGPPKGVMLSHRNIMWTIRSITMVVDIGPDDRFFSYLPLSHIAERTVSHFGQVVSGGQTWFARSILTVAEDLPACRPTIFFGVPRVWQKFRQGILDEVQSLDGPKGAIASRYLAIAEQVAADGGDLSLATRVLHKALDAAVGAKIRKQLGLDEVRLLVSAAAPIHPSLLRWFDAIGLPIVEVYGQTEDSGPTTMNPPGRARYGSVGLPVPGVSVRIADDGEVLVKGGNVCEGYYANPVATAELIDEDGWMHSGDVGRVDADGYLYITDRKKDLIINAAGKNIAPQEIETRLKVEPLISQAVVIGEGRPYLTALLTLDAEALRAWSLERGKPADVPTLLADEDLRSEIAASIERVNAERSRVEGIKRWTILPRDLTIADDELTATLKVKRKVVNERYATEIEELYREG